MRNVWDIILPLDNPVSFIKFAALSHMNNVLQSADRLPGFFSLRRRATSSQWRALPALRLRLNRLGLLLWKNGAKRKVSGNSGTGGRRWGIIGDDWPQQEQPRL
jgi:hypothetical protein